METPPTEGRSHVTAPRMKRLERALIPLTVRYSMTGWMLITGVISLRSSPAVAHQNTLGEPPRPHQAPVFVAAQLIMMKVRHRWDKTV